MKLLIDLQGAQTESRLRGIGRQNRMMARAMIAHGRGHDISILLNRGLPDGLDSLRDEFAALLPRDSIKFFDIPGHVAECHHDNLWRMRAAELIREAAIASLEPDVVHLGSLFEGINDDAVTSVGLLQASFATAITLHDLIPLYDPPRYLGSEASRRFFYRRAQSLKRADLLLAVSESAKREAVDMLSIDPERIKVALLAAGAEFCRQSLGEAERDRLRARYNLSPSFVLYVGAIEWRKNPDLLIEAYARLPEALQLANTLIFGGRILSQELLHIRSAACRHGINPAAIAFTGYIDEADLPAVYSMCSAFVFPSRHEGFGLPPLEAMACGAPVLAARNSSLPEVVGRDDLLFSIDDVAELAAKLERLLTDASYAASVRQWGIDRAANFSWDRAGAIAIEALEQAHERKSGARGRLVDTGRRPRLAYFSPLPNIRSGIADYSAELLKELGRSYDIECIVETGGTDDDWIQSNFVLRDLQFFRSHANSYDRIVYNVGNSEFHSYMFEFLERNPGVVILHDFFLSGIHSWLGNVGRSPKEDFLRELYLTHGLPALRSLVIDGRDAAARTYPANRIAFEESFGILVHSDEAIENARALYGDEVVKKMRKLPHLRAVSTLRDKAASRRKLGLDPDDFVVCSFGFVADTKLSDLLLEAWSASKAAGGGAARLIFVGELGHGEWADGMRAALAEAEVAVEVVGFASKETYREYICAADLAVQLRRFSRGETSGAVLDCLAGGVPLIVNAHGTMRELAEGVALVLPDDVTAGDLAAAIDKLRFDVVARARLAAAGVAHVRAAHFPTFVGEAMVAAIEAFYVRGEGARQQRLLEVLREVYAPTYPRDEDFSAVGRVLAGATRRTGLRRLLFDVTLMAESDARTGIERVVRGMLLQFLLEPPAGFRLEPVRIDGDRLRFARAFTAERLNIPADVLSDAEVDFDEGDVYVMLEWAADRLPQAAFWLQRFRRGGGRVVVGIHDLLPLIMPEKFPPHIPGVAERWFSQVLAVADQIICVSRSVADDVLHFGNALLERGRAPIAVDWFHNACDIAGSLPTTGYPENGAVALIRIKRQRSFLMVGTVEPRKGHLQVLLAFQALWAMGVEVTLVIVGKRGWMVEHVARMIAESPENGSRLFWYSDVSDEFLIELYRSCRALIAASEGEGFGLPLVEAASYGLPVIARDIPVFKEVAGEHACYFHGDEAAQVADAIQAWLAASDAGTVPGSAAMPRLSWAESAGAFVAAMKSRKHYGAIGAAPPVPADADGDQARPCDRHEPRVLTR